MLIVIRDSRRTLPRRVPRAARVRPSRHQLGMGAWKGGYRLYHVLVAGLDVETCEYGHRWRRDGLSDHAPIIARLRREA